MKNMNRYLEGAINFDADGIDFIAIGEYNKKFPKVIESYTREQLKEQVCFPKTCYLFYKIVNGQKEYLRDREIIDDPKITMGMLEDMKDSIVRAANKAGLTRNQLLDTLFEEGVLAVYNLGMKHMYEYLEEK